MKNKKMSQKTVFIFVLIGISLMVLIGIIFISQRDMDENNDENFASIEQNSDNDGRMDFQSHSMEYIPETDAPSTLSSPKIAFSDYGYYLVGASEILYYDGKSDTALPLCNRPDCSHEQMSYECNAQFVSSNDEFFSLNAFLQYYEGNLYTICADPKGYFSLYRIATDGSGREKAMDLYRVDTTSPQYPDDPNRIQIDYPLIFIHRGYVYYTDLKEKLPKLYRKKFGSDETEILYQTDTEGEIVLGMEFYGDYLFFQAKDVTKADGTGVYSIYCHNLITGEQQMILYDVMRDFRVYDKNLYYSTGTGIGRFSLETYENSILIDNGEQYSNISVDEKYIYAVDWDDRGKITIFSHTGELIQPMYEENVSTYIGRHQDKLFVDVKTQDRCNIAVFDTSQVGSENAKWQYLKVEE